MTSSTPLRAIVPMKPAFEAKARLAAVLDLEERAALALELLQHVLRAVSRARTPTETWVIGGDHWVRALAAQEGALWQADPGGGLNDAVGQAAAGAFQAGAAFLALPGDLGLLAPEDVDRLVARSRGLRRAVLARAASDGGTNALLLPPGGLVGPCFGPHSFSRHMEAARRAGVPVAACSSPGLSFDLDTPRDLELYRQQRPDLDRALASWRRKLRSPLASLAGRR